MRKLDPTMGKSILFDNQVGFQACKAGLIFENQSM